jgi:putative ABC transport system permease protein
MRHSAGLEVYDFRSMVVTTGDQALTQVKAVDDAWPLYGTAGSRPGDPLAQALAPQDGLPGAVMDPC